MTQEDQAKLPQPPTKGHSERTPRQSGASQRQKVRRPKPVVGAPLSNLVRQLCKPLLAKHRGIYFATLVLEWEDIVGPYFAASSRPERLQFAKGQNTQGTLTLAVAPSQLIDVQHERHRLIDRINGYFGKQLVGDLKTFRAANAPQPQETDQARPGLRGLPNRFSMLGKKKFTVPNDINDEDLRKALEELAGIVPS